MLAKYLPVAGHLLMCCASAASAGNEAFERAFTEFQAEQAKCADAKDAAPQREALERMAELTMTMTVQAVGPIAMADADRKRLDLARAATRACMAKAYR